MIILVTTTQDVHADLLVDKLSQRGAQFLRFNSDQFPQSIESSITVSNNVWHAQFSLPLGRKLDLDSITAGWCRSLSASSVSTALESDIERRVAAQESDAVIQGLLATLGQCYWMNHPYHISRAYSKVLQLKLAADIGFSVPPTLITNNPALFRSFYEDMNSRKITKMISLPWMLSEKGYLVYTNVIDESDLSDIDAVRNCPTLIQELVPKEIELRVTVVGETFFSMGIKSQLQSTTSVDWRHASSEELKRMAFRITLNGQVQQKCLRMMRMLNLTYAAFDFIQTPDGEPVFLEVNPHGAWGFVENCVAYPIADAIADHLVLAR